MSRARASLLAAVVAMVLLAPAVHAYLTLAVRTATGLVTLRWTRPIDYYVTNRDVPGVTAPQLQAAIGRAFTSWASVPRMAIQHRFGGFTSAEPFASDGVSVIGFRARPELDRTLGAATFEVDERTGEIVEVDIFFNTTFDWSVAPGGASGRFDVESVALHEVGHLLGLGHSALGETEIRPTGGRRVLGKRAVMFPIAYPAGNIEDRTLEADDRAGITDTYRTTSTSRDTGSISGRVTLQGSGVFGGHVTALHTRTGDLIGGFSLNAQGDFVIGGLTPGIYIVRVEPLDDADVDSFFDNHPAFSLNFRPAYFERLVAVPLGGSGPRVELKVVAK